MRYFIQWGSMAVEIPPVFGVALAMRFPDRTEIHENCVWINHP
jgi:hypothetical protein